MTHGNASAAVPLSTPVGTAHAEDFGRRACGAVDPAARRGGRVGSDAGPGPAHKTPAEAYMRPYPQTAKEPA